MSVVLTESTPSKTKGFRAVLGSPSLWQRIVGTAAAIGEESIAIVAGPNGIKVKAMDPSRIAMVEAEIPPSAFLDYECEEEVEVLVKAADVVKVVSRLRGETEIASDGNKIKHEARRSGAERYLQQKQVKEKVKVKEQVKVKELNGRGAEGDPKGHRKTFFIPLLSHIERLPQQLRFSYTTDILMPVEDLINALQNVSVVDNHVAVEADAGSLVLRASGERGDLEADLSQALLRAEASGKTTAVYPVGYMVRALRECAPGEVVRIQFSKDGPIQLDLPMSDSLVARFYLAPWVGEG